MPNGRTSRWWWTSGSAVQASSRLPGTLAEVKRLTAHPAFDIRNPNKVYALIRSFCGNQVRFHAADGAGYAFLADHICARRAQSAGRRAHRARLRPLEEVRSQRAAACALAARAHPRQPGLSKDTLEVVTKALA